jgi:hypothetical protein
LQHICAIVPGDGRHPGALLVAISMAVTIPPGQRGGPGGPAEGREPANQAPDVYTAATDPNHEMGRQGGYTSKVAWVDPRAIKAGAGNPASDRGGTEFGGGIEVFPTTASARARYEYLRGFQPPLGDGYDYLSGTTILRLSQYLTPAQAHAYRAAFTAAVGQ